MSFREYVSKAGGFQKLFKALRQQGIKVEDRINEAFSKDYPLFAKIGYKVEELDSGIARLSFPMTEMIMRTGGIVHGGIIMYSLDTTMGLAVMTLNPGIDQYTVELKTNFLEPLKDGPFQAKGKVVRIGRHTAVAEGEVVDINGRVCSKALGTWFLLNSI
ncbi:MAG: PaaI family thioesterase [Conexivisphaerales archaeon]